MSNSDFVVINIAIKFIKHLESLERMITYSEIIEKKHEEEKSNKSINDLLNIIIRAKSIIERKRRGPEAKENNDEKDELFLKTVDDLVSKNNLVRFINNHIDVVIKDDEGDGIHIKSTSSFVSKILDDHFFPEYELHRDINQLHNSVIISLVTGMELLVAEIFKDFIQNVDRSDLINNKNIAYSELVKIGSVEEARIFLIDGYIEDLLKQSFKSWINEITKVIKINVGKITILNDEVEKVFETFQRRHLLIHNDGIVNNLYLSKVDPELCIGISKDQKLENSKSYILSSIDRFRRFGIVLLYEYGFKIYRGNLDEFFGAFNELLLGLIQKGCLGARSIFKKAYQDNSLDHASRLVSQVNYYLSFHFNNEFENIRMEVEEFKVDTLSIEYKMARNILLGNIDQALDNFKTLSTTLDDNEFIELTEWPLIRTVKDQPEIKEFISKKIQSIINKEEALELEMQN